MSQYYVVPNIYSDMSDQSQGYFAFRFTCRRCYWQIDTAPIRSTVATVSNIADIGIGLLGGGWWRAAEAGQKLYGNKWHTEQAEALQKSWGEVKHHFHFCPKCADTVCTRCFNIRLNLCTSCAPDLRAEGAHYQHELNVEAQRQQIQENYQAPPFNVNAIPSAVTPDMLKPTGQPALPSAPGQAAGLPAPSAASIAGFSTPGYPREVMCPTCRRMGPPGKFCQDCGTKLPLPDLFCPNCATPAGEGARFCAECGTKLQSAI